MVRVDVGLLDVDEKKNLVLGSPLPFPDVSGDDSFCLLSQPGVGAKLGGKQSGSVGWVLSAWEAM